MKLDKKFTAKLVKGKNKGSWTRVIMPDSASFFGTRGIVKIKGTVDNYPLEASFMALGDGTHMLPIKSSIRKAINKDTGDNVTIHLT